MRTEGFEIRIVDLGHRRRHVYEPDELTVTETLAGGRVHDRARLGLELGERHTPLIGGGLHEQSSRLRTSTPERLEIRLHGQATRRV